MLVNIHSQKKRFVLVEKITPSRTYLFTSQSNDAISNQLPVDYLNQFLYFYFRLRSYFYLRTMKYTAYPLILLFTLSVASLQAQIKNTAETTDKFSTLLNYIDLMYVDTVNSSELVEKAIVHMLEELDPHSVYLSKE